MTTSITLTLTFISEESFIAFTFTGFFIEESSRTFLFNFAYYFTIKIMYLYYLITS